MNANENRRLAISLNSISAIIVLFAATHVYGQGFITQPVKRVDHGESTHMGVKAQGLVYVIDMFLWEDDGDFDTMTDSGQMIAYADAHGGAVAGASSAEFHHTSDARSNTAIDATTWVAQVTTLVTIDQVLDDGQVGSPEGSWFPTAKSLTKWEVEQNSSYPTRNDGALEGWIWIANVGQEDPSTEITGTIIESVGQHNNPSDPCVFVQLHNSYLQMYWDEFDTWTVDGDLDTGSGIVEFFDVIPSNSYVLAPVFSDTPPSTEIIMRGVIDMQGICELGYTQIRADDLMFIGDAWFTVRDYD